MSSMLESLIGMLSGDTLGKISKQVGVPEEKAKEALPDILAVLTGALAKNSSQQQSAQSLSNALAKDHDGSILNNLSDYINNYKSGEGDGILGHVLGGKRTALEQGLSKKTGLDMGTIANLLTMAAPLIMGALGKTQKQQGFSLDSLTNILGSESSEAKSLAPGAIEILNQILKSRAGSSQGGQQAGSSARKRSPIITIIIVVVIAVVVYFVLRACGIL